MFLYAAHKVAISFVWNRWRAFCYGRYPEARKQTWKNHNEPNYCDNVPRKMAALQRHFHKNCSADLSNIGTQRRISPFPLNEFDVTKRNSFDS